MELNEADGGHRRWVLCTNNENRDLNDDDPSHGICRSITKPRLDTVITGVRADGSRYSDGFLTGYQYYTLGFVPRREHDYDGNLRAYSRPPIVTSLASIEYGAHMSGRDDEHHTIVLDSSDSRILIPFDVRGRVLESRDYEALIKTYMSDDVLTGRKGIVLMPSWSVDIDVIKANHPELEVIEQRSLVPDRRFLS